MIQNTPDITTPNREEQLPENSGFEEANLREQETRIDKRHSIKHSGQMDLGRKEETLLDDENVNTEPEP